MAKQDRPNHPRPSKPQGPPSKPNTGNPRPDTRNNPPGKGVERPPRRK